MGTKHASFHKSLVRHFCSDCSDVFLSGARNAERCPKCRVLHKRATAKERARQQAKPAARSFGTTLKAENTEYAKQVFPEWHAGGPAPSGGLRYWLGTDSKLRAFDLRQ